MVQNKQNMAFSGQKKVEKRSFCKLGGRKKAFWRSRRKSGRKTLHTRAGAARAFAIRAFWAARLKGDIAFFQKGAAKTPLSSPCAAFPALRPCARRDTRIFALHGFAPQALRAFAKTLRAFRLCNGYKTRFSALRFLDNSSFIYEQSVKIDRFSIFF